MNVAASLCFSSTCISTKFEFDSFQTLRYMCAEDPGPEHLRKTLQRTATESIAQIVQAWISAQPSFKKAADMGKEHCLGAAARLRKVAMLSLV